MVRDATSLSIAGDWEGGAALPGEQVTVDLRWHDDALRIDLEAPFHGDPPPAGPIGSTEGLWRYEAVEIFVAGPPRPDREVRYTEIELGPWGHYLVLRFAGVRRRRSGEVPLRYAVERDGGRWRGRARLDARWLPPSPFRVNAYALHGVGAERRYLAAFPVPGRRLDFHQPSRFRAVG